MYKIPEGIEAKYAAPLMCGGATVFHTLKSFGVGTGERVGIFGVGGEFSSSLDSVMLCTSKRYCPREIV